MTEARLKVGLLATHPIQYYCPWYRALARQVDLHVFFMHRQTSEGQAAAGFGVAFDWDVPLLEGYRSSFLKNTARTPDVNGFWGCDTPEIRDIIAAGGFDAFIVHGWSNMSYWQAMMACWRSKTPIFVRGDSSLATPRPWWVRVGKWPVFRAFIPRFDGVLVVGEQARQYVLHYGASPDRCFPAPHSVDNDFFASRCDEARRERGGLRREFGLPEDGVVFLFVGRFIDRKRPGLFVEAIASVSRDAPGTTALMVGDGPLRDVTQSLAQRLAAPVRFTGFLNQTEMVRAYAVSDVLVVPSTWETWGLVVNEAMACGLPAIVSDRVAAAGDLVRPGVTGDVFPWAKSDGLGALVRRFATDEPYRNACSAAARAHVAHYDVAVAAAGTVRAVVEVLAKRRSMSRAAPVGANDGWSHE